MSGPDKSLLDRLSALKGGSPGVSMDRSSNALNVSLTGIEPAKPPSREDALAARLRSLRNTPEREVPPPQQTAKVTTPASSRLEAGDDDVDPLLQTDDQTLEDLLSDEDFGGSPQQWQSHSTNDESAKVNALLEELSKTSVDPSRGNGRDGSADGQDDDDDSDDGEMGREVDDLLSQAVEEARYNSRREPIPHTSGDEYGGQGASRDDHQGDGGMDLSLPSVPSTIAAPKADNEAQGGGHPDLGLPSVPSSAPKHDAASDFDNDIAARMAALSGLGGPSSDGAGGMGLPSAPTFQPADRSVKQKRLTSKTGYTDEDAATWCTVCLEDGTLQCLGCEDVYCTRCWHEMHVGPAAAFDGRTHKAVRFVKPGKDSERRVMLGAS
ncbi:hypothetical protein CSAL01_05278 [Colletotrichum salicis]|uniref:Zinc finger FYVE domain-containing protein n=1 Tax=Colletotrichum salicis TaxID=1209931 RepID=A0A135V1R4_9PEZI|nr:hypothetical protein CSAL01_05278 [Colletotrichum salicis]